ncbi:MAG: AAC(3) family N-acetyltransferase [Brumimicrobium sp.]
MISKEQLKNDLLKSGIQKGDILNMKVSLRSIGKLENGAVTLIEALLDVVGVEGTIVSDAFVDAKTYRSPFAEKEIVDENTKSYAGGFANAMIKYSGAFRSKHPIQKFVAIGNLAKKLTDKHTKDSFAYGVLKEMVLLKGKNVKIGPEEKVPGVGTTHIVICELKLEQKRVPKGVYYKEGDELKFHKINWVGGCGFGFTNLMSEFEKQRAILYKGKLGDADLSITDMAKTYEIEMNTLKTQPETILCKNEDCLDCRISWSFSDQTYFKFILDKIKSKKFQKAKAALSHFIFSKRLKGQQNIK